MKKSLFLMPFVLLAAGCSSIIDGTTQEIQIVTSPAGADCDLVREGKVIGRVNQTPGAVTVKKTKHDITITCTKKGYEKTEYINKSGFADATFGSILLGGGIGWGIDSASGADNKYTSPVSLTLSKK